MKIRIEIETGNAAFDYDVGGEVARILRKLADRVVKTPVVEGPIKLLDINGNTVGAMTVVEGG